jgi:3-hydroxybutyryl-CoA dehydrogenase
MREFEAVGISGFGVMGSSVGRFLRDRGIEVYVYSDSFPKKADGFNVVDDIDELVEKVDLVMEALPEQMDVKRSFYSRLSHTGGEVILASMTTSLPLQELAAVSGAPQMVLGVHFPLPNRVGEVAEIGWHSGTDRNVISRVEGFIRGLGVNCMVMEYSPGYVVARVVYRIVNEACYALFENVSASGDIDRAMRLGVNYPEGPLKWGDLIGLDTILSVLDNLEGYHRDGRFRPCPLLRRMVENGHLGVKSGRGFYNYKEEANGK